MADFAAGDGTIAYLDGGFDHRQGEAFDAIAKVGQVALLGGMELLGIPIVPVGCEERGVAGLGGHKKVFVGPECIVGIKCHGSDCVFHGDILAQTMGCANHHCLCRGLRRGL